jgi:hypothetical protein
MTDVRRTKHFFTSAQARNSNGRFEFTLREPIFNVASVKLKKFILPNFVGIVNSPYYFLRTDCIAITRDTYTLNGVPGQVVCVLPYSPHTVGFAVGIEEEDDSEVYNIIYCLQNLWFEILDYNGNVINPPDIGWSFCVELQIIINSH